MSLRILGIVPLLLTTSALGPAAAATTGPDPDGAAWLDALYDRIAEDLRAGQPLVFQVHVALCDNSIITCGGRGRGDGDNLDDNLYWATSGGFVGWFKRRGSPWTEVYRQRPESGEVLEVRVMRARLPPGAPWRRRGITGPIETYVVAHAWRGKAIDAALQAFVGDLYGSTPRTIRLPEGPSVGAGGAAQVVAYIGHNRFMDLPPYDFAAAEQRGQAGRKARDRRAPKGMMAVACQSAPYLAEVAARERVPLLLTADLLFAGSHSFEGAALAVAGGGSLPDIRLAATRSYGEGEGKSMDHLRLVFTNPSDRRWPFAAAQ